MTEKILLLHGLWLHPWAMRWLQQQFNAAGYEVITPVYHSISANSANNVGLVYQAVQRYAPSSLKRLGILYLTTCVGLGYDLMLPDA